MTGVKICGLTCLKDALAAAEVGADLLGFVLVPSSPRCVSPYQAERLIAALRQEGVALPCVGVVAGLPWRQLQALREDCGFDFMQVYEDGLELVCAPGAPGERERLILACKMTGPSSLANLGARRAFAYLLDGQGPQRGTASAPWDWRLVASAGIPGRVIVAGGLRPDNVAEAVRQARPWGVDVASGVEERPGRKDAAAVARFIQAVREVDHEDQDAGIDGRVP